MNAMIDTLKVARTIEDSGLTKIQAETFAAVLADATSASREDLVTKDFLRSELSVTRSELRTEIASLKNELRSEIANVKNELIRWTLGSQVMVVVILVALANFSRTFG